MHGSFISIDESCSEMRRAPYSYFGSVPSRRTKKASWNHSYVWLRKVVGRLSIAKPDKCKDLSSRGAGRPSARRYSSVARELAHPIERCMGRGRKSEGRSGLKVSRSAAGRVGSRVQRVAATLEAELIATAVRRKTDGWDGGMFEPYERSVMDRYPCPDISARVLPTAFDLELESR
jgi:hypothetical protein